MAIPYGDVFTMMLMACHYDHGMLNAVSTHDADGITTFVLEKINKIGGKKLPMYGKFEEKSSLDGLLCGYNMI
jgi:hypothetical protein